MKNLIATFTLLLSIQFFSYGQGVISFEKTTHDFGDIDKGSIASYEFEFTNTGNQPIVISKVQPSCGCTVSSFTRKPVKPGEKGKVKATFNSNKGGDGSFNKSVKVYSNAKEDMELLFIKGKVKSHRTVPKVSNNNTLKGKLNPKLTLDKAKFDYGKVENRSAVSERFVIKNSGKSTLNIQGFASMCQCIRYDITTTKIRPGSAAILTLTYTPKEARNLKEVFTLYSDDPDNMEMPIQLSAEVYENFSKAMFIGRKETVLFE